MNPLVIPGILDSLGPIRAFVNQASTAAGLDDDKSYSLALAVDELATNVAIHGYQEHGQTGDITVRVEQTPDELVVMLEDTAPAYDPRTHKVPCEQDLLKPLEERDIGGLGVYLALQGVDRFDYEHIGNRNRSILAMKRTRS